MNIREREQLAVDIAKSIHGITWPSAYQEPDYVAKLVTTLPGEIMKSLISLLPGRKTSNSSIELYSDAALGLI